ncbi:hypothetical protein MNBD_IGNAVI01-1321 [hydrothermal vent metagenome]|uniref:HTH merR-type domain-containing protein n=1 Tax=hydrothermal vent metagenome TaxID=652676 RepID=A0A3B1CWP8_9ZZZZ
MSIKVNILDSTPIYHIGEAATILGISVHTIRMYEKEGLILPRKTSTNQRVYSKKDLDKIQCIRNSIREKKVGINGIKIIYSLIPCWEVIKCSEEDRKNCGAFNSYEKPCWNYNHPNTVCENKECVDCDVYQEYTHCDKIKELIKTI